MSFKHTRGITAISLFVIAAVMQTYVGVTFAARASGINSLPAEVQDISGILTTAGNKPITVNGSTATTGATILSGATIETPDQVTATVNIPGHGIVEIAANTKFTLEFSETGIKINLIQGCLVLHTKKGTSGEVRNAQGVIGKVDPANDGKVDVCPTRVAGAAAGGGGGIGTGATVAIVAGVGVGIVAVAFALRGDNPSPGAP